MGICSPVLAPASNQTLGSRGGGLTGLALIPSDCHQKLEQVETRSAVNLCFALVLTSMHFNFFVFFFFSSPSSSKWPRSSWPFSSSSYRCSSCSSSTSCLCSVRGCWPSSPGSLLCLCNPLHKVGEGLGWQSQGKGAHSHRIVSWGRERAHRLME